MEVKVKGTLEEGVPGLHTTSLVVNVSGTYIERKLKGKAYGPGCHFSTIRCDHEADDGGVGLHVRPSPTIYLLKRP